MQVIHEKMPVSVEDAITRTVESADRAYDRCGVVESLGHKLDKATLIIAKLTAVLARNGLLNATELDALIAWDMKVVD